MIQGIIEILIDDTGVQQLVGTDVFPVRFPQEDGKLGGLSRYLTVYKTPGQPTQSKDFTSGLDLDNFNVNCYASNYSDAYGIYEAVRLALDKRSIAFTTDSGFTYNGIWFNSDYDAFDDSARKFIHVLSFSCHTKRTQTGR